MAQNNAPTPTLPRKRGRESEAKPRTGGGDAAGGRAPPVQAMQPDQLAERVLYRDGLMLVIDKPAGIPVHSGPGGGPHLEHWFPLLRFGLPRLARTEAAHRPHSSGAGALRGARLSGLGRYRLWRPGRGSAAAPRPRDRAAALSGEAPRHRYRAGAATHARRADPPRLRSDRG